MNKESALRIGIVGLGYWGPNLLRNLAEVDNGDLVAACDVDERRFGRLEKRYRGVLFTTSLSELLSMVDALVVATPVETHFPIAKKALAEGKHVLLEKPMTAKLEEAIELVNLSEQKRVTLMVDHVFVYHPAVRTIKEILDRGELGKLSYFDSLRQNWGARQVDVNAIWDLAIHDVAILSYLFARRPESVIAVGNRAGRRRDEDRASLHLFYPETDFVADISVSNISPVKVRTIKIGGEKRLLVYDDVQVGERIKIYEHVVDEELDEKGRFAVRWNYRVGPMYSPNVPIEEALLNVCRHFVTCILENRRPLTGGEQGLEVVGILQKACESLKSGGERIRIEDYAHKRRQI